MFAFHNTSKEVGKGKPVRPDRELHKLRRMDLLELLVEQVRVNDAQKASLGELGDLADRLKAKLDEKDAQIERLKAKLDDKDAQIEHLKSRLDDKDARIAGLESRGSKQPAVESAVAEDERALGEHAEDPLAHASVPDEAPDDGGQ